MNWYFYRIFIPLTLLWAISFVLLAVGKIEFSLIGFFFFWFLIGPVGIGVGFHRLFSHRQFETWRPIELTLAVLGTLAAYAPLLFWASNHQYHHRTSDSAKDPSSPKQVGFWESFLWYRMRNTTLDKIDLKNYCSRKIMTDPKLRWLSRNFTKIIWITAALLAVIKIEYLINFYLLPVLAEHIRINLVSSISHINIPFSYRNYETEDDSQNNLIFGYLSFGFAWHNNHHKNERQLCLHDKWWEIDLEGSIGKMISKRQKTQEI